MLSHCLPAGLRGFLFTSRMTSSVIGGYLRLKLGVCCRFASKRV